MQGEGGVFTDNGLFLINPWAYVTITVIVTVDLINILEWFMHSFYAGAVRFWLIGCLASLLLITSATSQGLSRLSFVEGDHQYEGVEVVLEGLSSPWDMVFINNHEILVTQRGGELKRINLTTKAVTYIAGVPEVSFSGQGGLLAVALHPDFTRTQQLYLSYTARSESGHKHQIRLAKARLQGDQLVELQVIFKALPTVNGGSNLGGALLITDKDTIFLSVGEHRSRENLQSTASYLGSIIRLNTDGSIPENNPFVGEANALPEIYSYGHRNPQGMTIDKNTGEIWAVEHGPRGGDEVNKLEAGANYGWPLVTYGVEYSGRKITDLPDHGVFKEPYFYYTPSIAPSDILLYQQDKYPKWQNHFLITALKGRHISVLKIQNGEMRETEKLLEGLARRIRAINTSPDGFIFVLTDNGELLKLQVPLARG